MKAYFEARAARRTALKAGKLRHKLWDERARALNTQVCEMIEKGEQITPADVERLCALGSDDAPLYAQAVLRNLPLAAVEPVRAAFIARTGPHWRLARV